MPNCTVCKKRLVANGNKRANGRGGDAKWHDETHKKCKKSKVNIPWMIEQLKTHAIGSRDLEFHENVAGISEKLLL